MKFGKKKVKYDETVDFQESNNHWKKMVGKTGKTLKIVIGIVILLLLITSSFYTIREEEQAVLCTLGKPKAVTKPGLHF